MMKVLCKKRGGNKGIPLSILLLGGILLAAGEGHAQFEFPVLDAQVGGMGGAAVALPYDRAGLYNVAGLAFADATTAVLSVRNEFMIKQLTAEAVGVVLPLNKKTGAGTVALQFLNQGSVNFYQQRAAATYALPLARRLALGVEFDYVHAGSGDAYYADYHFLSCAVGVQWRPSERWCAGAVVHNPASLRLHDVAGIGLPWTWSAGVAWQPLSDMLATVEVEQRQGAKTALHVGVEYGVAGCVFFRAGFATRPSAYTMGMGYRRQHYGVDVAMQVHQFLGMTPQLTAYYCF